MDEAAEAASTTEPIIAQVVREATATDAERFPVVLASFVGVHDVCLPNAVPYGDADTTVYSRKRRRRPETPVVRSASGGMAPISVTPRGPSVMHPRSLPTMGTLGTYLVHYHGTFGMDAFGEDEFQLEDVRASGYLDRMDSILNDHQTRKHTLTLVPPDAYNSAVYMQRVAQSAHVLHRESRNRRACSLGPHSNHDVCGRGDQKQARVRAARRDCGNGGLVTLQNVYIHTYRIYI